jgi:hypothetical protein
MPFQKDSSIDTALWRYQTLLNSVVTVEQYVNLGQVKYMKINRIGPNAHVWIWYDLNKSKDKEPDVVLEGDAAVQFYTDMDTVFAN